MHLFWTSWLNKANVSHTVSAYETTSSEKNSRGFFLISAAGALCGFFVETTITQLEGEEVLLTKIVALFIAQINPLAHPSSLLNLTWIKTAVSPQTLPYMYVSL